MTKTKISATVVADSKNQFGNRITTMLVTFPRIILAEFNTHRMFSRNTASSRAIPFEKMLKSIEEDPFIPIAWQKDHKGMQGGDYITGKQLELNIFGWLKAKDGAISNAKYLNHGLEGGVTKQLCNRLLEPFMWTTVIVTATEWENFFALRCPRYVTLDNTEYRSWKDLIDDKKSKEAPEDWIESARNYNILDRLKCNKGQAEIHMMALAEAMWDAYNESNPKQLQAGEWHIPFGENIKEDDIYNRINNPVTGNILDWKPIKGIDNGAEEYYQKAKIKIATAMCARTSYTVVGEDQKPLTYERMFEIHDNLTTSDPVHASPFEHCALASINPERSRNFTGGWKQYRDLLNL